MENNLICSFCGKEFQREKMFIKHRCEKMKRYDAFDKPEGQLAFLSFNMWRTMKGFGAMNVEKFVSSKYFNTFVKFALFYRRNSVPDLVGFMQLMMDKGISPFYWADHETYDIYLKNFDEDDNIVKKIEISIETMDDWCNLHNCTMETIYECIPPIEILKLVTSRKISPWVLLPSTKFKDFLMNKTTSEERMLFTKFIDISKWRTAFDNNPEMLAKVKELNKTLGIA